MHKVSIRHSTHGISAGIASDPNVRARASFALSWWKLVVFDAAIAYSLNRKNQAYLTIIGLYVRPGRRKKA
ncbi:hypothetical protein [Bradyrhizobium sp. AZCC 1678]|uniref:hypothetical protein n=1 Tax=Bradyrhizobium sp. AZCC 1678 TaxID=3117030 RepID=UPI002FF0EFC2